MNVVQFEEYGIRLISALLIGSIIGAEREYRSKSAGFRTMTLICIGSAIYTIVSLSFSDSFSRIASNIVTGVGFIGGGVIFKEKASVKGITTASLIWIMAALGMACGIGAFGLAGLGTAITLSVLLIFSTIEVFIDNHSQTRNYKIVCNFKKSTLYHYEKIIQHHKLSYKRMEQSSNRETIEGNWEVTGNKKHHEALVKDIMADKEILSFDF